MSNCSAGTLEQQGFWFYFKLRLQTNGDNWENIPGPLLHECYLLLPPRPIESVSKFRTSSSPGLRYNGQFSVYVSIQFALLSKR
jgi:hypothetical protein